MLVGYSAIQTFEVGVVAHYVEEHACVGYIEIDIAGIYVVLWEKLLVEEFFRERVSERVSDESIFVHGGLGDEV